MQRVQHRNVTFKSVLVSDVFLWSETVRLQFVHFMVCFRFLASEKPHFGEGRDVVLPPTLEWSGLFNNN